MENNDYQQDKPVNVETEDKFQRYNFARRIAETIIHRQNNDGIVIGIYGAWGEGKTSVINFIDFELSKASDDVIRIEFNPWRYSDENSLLLSFFLKISKALGIKLLNKKEQAGLLLSKKSDFISIDIPKIGDISKVVKTIGNWLGNVDLEELKQRLNEKIKNSEKKLVIFIDDINRLDKNEIHSVFRLVKLTADFYNTTYVLSFDDKVVSKSISERLGNGDIESGRNFLEKIIQVPLTLPKAQAKDLSDYFFEMLNGIFQVNSLNLSDGENRRFTYLFTPYLLKKFDTPRMVVRYTNSLSFAIPLLAGEANIVDLMIIEAIKMIYPNVYQFIKDNPSYFIQSSYNILSNDQKSRIKEDIDDLCTSFSDKEKESVIELLQKLFPTLEIIFQNRPYTDLITIESYKNKRIVSPEYFNRYFTYSVGKGEIPDILFEQFISNIPKMSENKKIEEIKKLIQHSSADNLIYKLRSIEDNLSWETAKKLIIVLNANTKLFPLDLQNYSFESQSPKGQLALFIYQLIKKHNEIKEQLSTSKYIITASDSLEFTFDVLRWLNPKEDATNNIFTEKQYKEIWNTLLFDNILKKAGKKDIFEKFPKEAYIICKFWEQLDKNGFNKYIHQIIDKNPNKSIAILRTYLPKLRTIGEDNDLTKNIYDYLTSIIDPKYLYLNLLKIYPETELNTQEVEWKSADEENLSDLKMVRQFYHWYKHDNNKELSQISDI